MHAFLWFLASFLYFFSQMASLTKPSLFASVLVSSSLASIGSYQVLAQEVTEISTTDDEIDSFEENEERELTKMEQLFGKTLYVLGYDTDKDGKEQKAVFEAGFQELVKDANVIGVYFSASWCAPCRQFTPVLAKFYNEMKKQGKKLEIIWISRDQTSEDFLQYFAKMPWLAVTMQNIQSVYNKLAPSFQVKGIPHLVFIDAQSGDVITLDGRTKVLQDPYGLQFPWRGRSVANLLPSSVKQSLVAQLKSLQTKLKGLLRNFLSGFLPSSLVKQFMKR